MRTEEVFDFDVFFGKHPHLASEFLKQELLYRFFLVILADDA